MNANPKFLAATAHVDDAAVQPLPNSTKIYVGPLRVPMREIAQSGGNPPLAVYDTSGPYTDPAATIDIRKGLSALRERWILERSDTQLLEGPSSAYGRTRLEDPKLAELRFDLHRKPRQRQENVTQMHYAKKGIITPEMEFIASARTSGSSQHWLFNTRANRSARACRRSSRRSSCAAKSRAGAPSSRRTSTTRKPSR